MQLGLLVIRLTDGGSAAGRSSHSSARGLVERGRPIAVKRISELR
jgi:hypothetical protein